MTYAIYKRFPFLFDHLNDVFHSSAKGDVPFQWFISLLHALYKGKGPTDIPTSYRDVLLNDVSGKVMRKHLR